MKICVISDTHARHIKDLPSSLISIMKNVDIIVHLGDYDTVELVDELKKLGNFWGVTGNHDFSKIRAVLPKKYILDVNGKKLGLVHGHGCSMPTGLKNGLKSRFNGDKVDAILYGHTHVTRNKVVDDVLYFNPGSAAGRFPAYRGSYGVLNVGDDICGEIFPITSQHKWDMQFSKAQTLAYHLAMPRRVLYRAVKLW
ncbi:metallophosphoesterase family protein [Chloroflexota bacterium]